MKKHLLISKKIFFAASATILVFVGTVVSAFVNRVPVLIFQPSTAIEDSINYLQIHPPIFPKQISFADENVPLALPDIRERFDKELIINTYLQGSSMLNMKQTTRWFPQIESILKQNGVPPDFKYLCMAESGLQQVVSRAGAAGFWQFMEETGRKYGLEINEEIDERYNVEKATQAACSYLTNSKNELGNWTLAAAAYNCGIAGAEKFMEQQHQNNYYDLLLPDETMRYVFRILAIKEIYSHPMRYGFNLTENDFYPPYQFRVISVSNSIPDLAQFAIENGTNYKMLKMLNPWLRKPFLKNMKHKTYDIKLPL